MLAIVLAVGLVVDDAIREMRDLILRFLAGIILLPQHFNAVVFFDSLKSQKPASLKGSYVKSVFITTSMGPSIQIENIYN